MTRATSGITLAIVMLACMTVVEAQSCPNVGGMYEAHIPHQGQCQMLVDDTDQDLVVDPRDPLMHTVFVSTMLWCADQLADRGVGMYHQSGVGGPDEECKLELDIEVKQFIIAHEGEELWTGVGFGLPAPVYTDDPLAVCQAAAEVVDGTTLLGLPPIENLAVVDEVPDGLGLGGVKFKCQFDQPAYGLVNQVTPTQGHIYPQTVNEAAYQESPMRYRLMLEPNGDRTPGSLIDRNPGVYTPTLSGEESYDNADRNAVRLRPCDGSDCPFN